MIHCSEEYCDKEAISEIWIKGISNFTKKNYQILVYVCGKHYLIEEKAGGLVKVERNL